MPPATAPQVHRLEDIRVIEVSLVDKAANRRTVLLTKRDGAAKPEFPAAEFGKVADFLAAVAKAAGDVTVTVPPAVAPAPVASPELTAKVAELEKAIADANTKQAETDAKLVDAEKRATEATAAVTKVTAIVGERDATITRMKTQLNEQAAVIEKARKSGPSNGGDGDGRPPAVAVTKWGGDLAAELPKDARR
jgi:uncharacterized coiled-coil protein SlyX